MYAFVYIYNNWSLIVQVKGISVSSPYRLRPVVDVKLPLNASFTPLIYMHNPHPEALQVCRYYLIDSKYVYVSALLLIYDFVDCI